MKLIKSSKNYQRLFHFKGIGTFINSTWMAFYKNIDAMVTAIDDDCYMWLPKASLDSQLDEGAEFFADNEKFDEYYNAHVNFLKSLKLTFDSEIKDKNKLTRENVEKFLNCLCTVFFFFSKTEFFYLDKAYKLSEFNPQMKENLMRHYKLKEKSRVEAINNVWFGDESYVKVLFRKLSQQFDVPASDFEQYTVDDVLALFDGNKLDATVIQARKVGRIIYAENTIIISHFGPRTKDDILALLEQTGEAIPSKVTFLKGIPASKGKVTGKVKIIVSDPTTFGSLAQEFARMQKGDVLVAETTSPEFMPACEKAAAILANQGGLLSHAAVVSREFGIPCVVALKFATQVFKDGDIVEVDGEKGIVRKL